MFQLKKTSFASPCDNGWTDCRAKVTQCMELNAEDFSLASELVRLTKMATSLAYLDQVKGEV